MAQRSATIACEDVPRDDACRMRRGPRRDPERYQALQETIGALDTTATRLTRPEGTNLTTMKTRIPRGLQRSICR